MRTEIDARAMHFQDLALVEQWLLPLVHIPRVCLANKARHEEYGCAEAVPSQHRPGGVVRGTVAVVECDDDRTAGKFSPLLLVRYPPIKGDGFVVPAF